MNNGLKTDVDPFGYRPLKRRKRKHSSNQSSSTQAISQKLSSKTSSTKGSQFEYGLHCNEENRNEANKRNLWSICHPIQSQKKETKLQNSCSQRKSYDDLIKLLESPFQVSSIPKFLQEGTDSKPRTESWTKSNTLAVQTRSEPFVNPLPLTQTERLDHNRNRDKGTWFTQYHRQNLANVRLRSQGPSDGASQSANHTPTAMHQPGQTATESPGPKSPLFESPGPSNSLMLSQSPAMTPGGSLGTITLEPFSMLNHKDFAPRPLLQHEKAEFEKNADEIPTIPEGTIATTLPKSPKPNGLPKGQQQISECRQIQEKSKQMLRPSKYTNPSPVPTAGTGDNALGTSTSSVVQPNHNATCDSVKELDFVCFQGVLKNMWTANGYDCDDQQQRSDLPYKIKLEPRDSPLEDEVLIPLSPQITNADIRASSNPHCSVNLEEELLDNSMEPSQENCEGDTGDCDLNKRTDAKDNNKKEAEALPIEDEKPPIECLVKKNESDIDIEIKMQTSKRLSRLQMTIPKTGGKAIVKAYFYEPNEMSHDVCSEIGVRGHQKTATDNEQAIA